LGFTSIASAEEKTALVEAAEMMKPIIEVPANTLRKASCRALPTEKGR